MIQRDNNAIRLGMLAGLIRVAKFHAALWTRNADVRFLLDTGIESLEKAYDLLTMPKPIEAPND